MPTLRTPIHARRTRPSALVNACDLYARTLFRRDVKQVQLAKARSHEAELKAALADAEQATAQVLTELSELEGVLLEAGRVIQSFDEGLEPQRIRALRTTKGRYGTSGGMSGAILRTLARASPAGLSLMHLRAAVINALELSFATSSAAYAWSENSFRPALKRLRRQGDVVYLDPGDPQGRGGVWRLAGDSIPTSLDALRAEVGVELEASEHDSAAPPPDA